MKLIAFEDYLRTAAKAGVIDHALRYDGERDGFVKIYIHPALVSGDTADYEVNGNDLAPCLTSSDVDEFMNADCNITEEDRAMLKNLDIIAVIQKAKLNREIQDGRLILLVDCILSLAKTKPETTIATFARLVPVLMKFVEAAMTEANAGKGAVE